MSVIDDFFGPEADPIPEDHKSGYVAIVGKPNAGKSTLMNAMVGARLSITTYKPQTTRHRILGIQSDDASQIIFMDTPGLIDPRYKLQEAMMKAAESAVKDADMLLFLIDPNETDGLEEMVKAVAGKRMTKYLVINKADKFDQQKRDAVAARFYEAGKFDAQFHISALQSEGLDELKHAIIEKLPLGPPFYPKSQLSEFPERFFTAELIREQIFLQYHQEIPYSCTVNVVSFTEKPKLTHIDAEIVVNRNSQKGILIGKKGAALKKVGIEARKAVEEFLHTKVHLDLHVKVRAKWREKEHFVRGYGYK